MTKNKENCGSQLDTADLTVGLLSEYCHKPLANIAVYSSWVVVKWSVEDFKNGSWKENISIES